jgi:hypothetical protein
MIVRVRDLLSITMCAEEVIVRIFSVLRFGIRTIFMLIFILWAGARICFAGMAWSG